MNRGRLVVPALLALVLSGPALAGTRPRHGAADRAFAAAAMRMHDTMAAATTGDPDRDFATLMIPHHQGAIDMAKVELRYGRDARLRALARSIVAAQDREIAIMRRWLARHGR